ncbi:hypothetical protein, partial [Streptomyces mirabilis]|uniref:hypothetical protein n=1 Tax=Streptomyces mirabilis TaxID=68239 RepID=UPI0036F1611B
MSVFCASHSKTAPWSIAACVDALMAAQVSMALSALAAKDDEVQRLRRELMPRQATFATFVVDPEPTVGDVAPCIEVERYGCRPRCEPERPERRIGRALGLRSGSHHDGV